MYQVDALRCEIRHVCSGACAFGRLASRLSDVSPESSLVRTLLWHGLEANSERVHEFTRRWNHRSVDIAVVIVLDMTDPTRRSTIPGEPQSSQRVKGVFHICCLIPCRSPKSTTGLFQRHDELFHARWRKQLVFIQVQACQVACKR